MRALSACSSASALRFSDGARGTNASDASRAAAPDDEDEDEDEDEHEDEDEDDDDTNDIASAVDAIAAEADVAKEGDGEA